MHVKINGKMVRNLENLSPAKIAALLETKRQEVLAFQREIMTWSDLRRKSHGDHALFHMREDCTLMEQLLEEKAEMA